MTSLQRVQVIQLTAGRTVEAHSDPSLIGMSIEDLARRELAARRAYHEARAVLSYLPRAYSPGEIEQLRFEALACESDLEEALDRFHNPGGY